MSAHLNVLTDILSRIRLIVDDEKSVQEQIAAALFQATIGFEREVRLSPGDIIDFVSDRVGVEVKIKGGKRAILRQIERYADSNQIDSLILLSNVAMGVPAEINGKPVRFVSMGRAWL